MVEEVPISYVRAIKQVLLYLFVLLAFAFQWTWLESVQAVSKRFCAVNERLIWKDSH